MATDHRHVNHCNHTKAISVSLAIQEFHYEVQDITAEFPPGYLKQKEGKYNL